MTDQRIRQLLSRKRAILLGKTDEEMAAYQQERWCLTLVQLDAILAMSHGRIYESAAFLVAEILRGDDPAPSRLRTITELWYAACDQKEGRIPRFEGLNLDPFANTHGLPQMPYGSLPQVPYGILLEIPPHQTIREPLRLDIPTEIHSVEFRGEGAVTLLSVVYRNLNQIAAPIYTPTGPESWRLGPFRFPPLGVYPGGPSFEVTMRNRDPETRRVYGVFWGVPLSQPIL